MVGAWALVSEKACVIVPALEDAVMAIGNDSPVRVADVP